MKNSLFSQMGAVGVLLCALAGAVYSGILAYGNLVTGVCSFGAVCPYFLGFPVCIFGFIGFLIVLFLLVATIQSEEKQARKTANGLFWFSLGGSLFALYYLVQELFFIPGVKEAPLRIGFGYPSCLYGFVLFGGIFLLVRYALKRSDINS